MAVACNRLDGWRSTDERAAVDVDDVLHVRRPRRGHGSRLGDELLDRGEGQSGVEAALLPDRGRSLGTHPGAAERARHVPGHHADVVGQLEQPVEAVEETLGAVACVDGEIGAGGGADEQRVTGQQRVAGEKAAVLRAMARRVDRPHRDAADCDLVPVGERLVRVGDACIAVDRDGQSLLERQAAVAGDMVGVRVGLEDARDAQALRRGLLEERLDGERRVDEHCLAGLFVTDQVRRAAEVVVDELAQEHHAGTYHRLLLYFLKFAPATTGRGASR